MTTPLGSQMGNLARSTQSKVIAFRLCSSCAPKDVHFAIAVFKMRCEATKQVETRLSRTHFTCFSSS